MSSNGIEAEDSMGAGRRTQTFYAAESWAPLPGNGSLPTRNLDKKDLGGVIFGCKHNTMQECLTKQLFGLPHGHFSYVRNIGEGLPLFLFNYSDRKLHGIYEAASNGRMSFDAYAWTDGGSERTPYPAQVYIRTRTQCQPLTENQFKTIILDNYFAASHFWFELDHAQTGGLIALFKPSPHISFVKELFPPLPAKKLAPKKELVARPPPTKWKVVENNEYPDAEAGPNKARYTKFEDVDSKGTVSDWEDLSEDNMHKLGSGSNSGNGALEKEEERVLLLLQKLATEREHLKSSSSGEMSTWSDYNYVNAEPVSIPTSSDINYANELEHLKSSSSEENSIGSGYNYVNAEQVPIPASFDVNYANGEDVEKLSNSGIIHGSDEVVNGRLVRALEELKERTSNLEKQRAEQDRELELLKNGFMDAEKKVQLLQDRVKELEAKSIPLVDDFLDDKYFKKSFCPEDKIYLIGGFDGCSWLSSLDCFSPSFNTITPLKSMSSDRSYASAVALDGMLYVFGGGDGNLWFDSVECYNWRCDEWTLCPSMKHQRGSLAGATLNGKIFAIGGGNGVECFPDVEMLDPEQGRWISNQSMLHTRFAPAAAELNGVIYAFGGYDGKAYLRSAERFDPRVGSWTEVPSMNVRRGSHSVAVLNEKIYCMGGYNGDEMVSSLEIFDPRLDSWVMGDPMNSERGYAATSVFGNSIISIGGVKDDEVIVDTVECYREGSGWITTGWNAIGKRCFCSAIVL